MTLQIKAQTPIYPAKYSSSLRDRTATELPVFPGAVGFGSETVAGRYGQVIKVTNLNASGEGSLRAAIEATGPRVVVFEVSGAIQLTSDLSISNPFITIAGQTAPSPGIMIRGAALSILTHDVLVQHIRVRAGDDPVGPDYENRDALKIDNSQGQTYNVVIDHCSFSWAVDESVSLWHPGIYNVTILNSIISEGLHESFHPKGAHSKGLIVGPHITKVTVYGNLMAHNQQRNIRAGLGSTNIEEVNNLIYNWGSTAADSEGELDVIGNHFIAGEGTTRQTGIFLRSETTKIYSEDNLDVNGSGNVQTPLTQSLIPKTSLMPSSEVYDYVLAYAGARPADRDIVDKRVVNEVKTRTGNFKHSVTGAGGWPVYAENTRSVESDIPVVGPIPSDPNADSDSDGYTDLEEWLHALAAELEKANPATGSNKLTYRDPGLPVEKRVEDLISRMTLEEKIGQLNIPCLFTEKMGKDIPEKMEACKEFTKGTYEEGVGPGGGFFSMSDEILHNGPRQQAEFINELQRIAREETRLGIPLFIIEEGTHGFVASGATIFPEGLAIGSTWNTDLVEKIYSTAAREARSVGAHQLYTLVIEPNRDPRMGRNMEGYAEDTYLCSRIAESIVAGAQGDDISGGDKVIAGLSHFPGQSQGTSGLERSPMEISERQLREIFLPPWEAGIKKAGALGVMATYPSIDGIPTHASEKILTKILREELGFKGMVVSEGYGIGTLVHERVVPGQKEAAAKTIHAGVDVGITYEPAYMMPLIENVREGKVPMSEVDRAVKRVLNLKFQMGLFENPYVNTDKAVKTSHTPENQNLALQVAREGIVLLKNENNLLPLKNNIRSIAVIGPNADDERNQLGDYTSFSIPQDIVTVLDGLKNKVSSHTKIEYVKGCNVVGAGLNEIEKARKAAKKSDIAIVVVGENERRAVDENNKEVGTNGENKDVASLDLTGLQEELIKAVHSTGTPTIVVLINGRPLSTRWTSENVPAIVEAWIPGEKGGDAIADVLFGDYNPNGRLPITIPRHSGQLPVFYNYHPSRQNMSDYIGYQDMPLSPLYEFGFGLSYTGFDYSNLQIQQESEGIASDVFVSVDIQNTGKREGAEVVQLYINDVISSVVTPYIELKGFEKVWLEAGEKKTVKFNLTPEDLSFINVDMKPIVEPGEFEVLVGKSSKDIVLKGSFIKQ